MVQSANQYHRPKSDGPHDKPDEQEKSRGIQNKIPDELNSDSVSAQAGVSPVTL